MTSQTETPSREELSPKVQQDVLQAAHILGTVTGQLVPSTEILPAPTTVLGEPLAPLSDIHDCTRCAVVASCGLLNMMNTNDKLKARFESVAKLRSSNPSALDSPDFETFIKNDMNSSSEKPTAPSKTADFVVPSDSVQTDMPRKTSVEIKQTVSPHLSERADFIAPSETVPVQTSEFSNGSLADIQKVPSPEMPTPQEPFQKMMKIADMPFEAKTEPRGERATPQTTRKAEKILEPAPVGTYKHEETPTEVPHVVRPEKKKETVFSKKQEIKNPSQKQKAEPQLTDSPVLTEALHPSDRLQPVYRKTTHTSEPTIYEPKPEKKIERTTKNTVIDANMLSEPVIIQNVDIDLPLAVSTSEMVAIHTEEQTDFDPVAAVQTNLSNPEHNEYLPEISENVFSAPPLELTMSEGVSEENFTIPMMQTTTILSPELTEADTPIYLEEPSLNITESVVITDTVVEQKLDTPSPDVIEYTMPVTAETSLLPAPEETPAAPVLQAVENAVPTGEMIVIQSEESVQITTTNPEKKITRISVYQYEQGTIDHTTINEFAPHAHDVLRSIPLFQQDKNEKEAAPQEFKNDPTPTDDLFVLVQWYLLTVLRIFSAMELSQVTSVRAETRRKLFVLDL